MSAQQTDVDCFTMITDDRKISSTTQIMEEADSSKRPCFHCFSPNHTATIPLLVSFDTLKHLYTVGAERFCSFPCAKAYIIARQGMGARELSLLARYATEKLGNKAYGIIEPAPPRTWLVQFGGSISYTDEMRGTMPPMSFLEGPFVRQPYTCTGQFSTAAEDGSEAPCTDLATIATSVVRSTKPSRFETFLHAMDNKANEKKKRKTTRKSSSSSQKTKKRRVICIGDLYE